MKRENLIIGPADLLDTFNELYNRGWLVNTEGSPYAYREFANKRGETVKFVISQNRWQWTCLDFKTVDSRGNTKWTSPHPVNCLWLSADDIHTMAMKALTHHLNA